MKNDFVNYKYNKQETQTTPQKNNIRFGYTRKLKMQTFFFFFRDIKVLLKEKRAKPKYLWRIQELHNKLKPKKLKRSRNSKKEQSMVFSQSNNFQRKMFKRPRIMFIPNTPH